MSEDSTPSPRRELDTVLGEAAIASKERILNERQSSPDRLRREFQVHSHHF
jgi:hypothetical protein